MTATSGPLDEQRAVPESHSIVLFDGECNLCNASVRFIIERDSSDRFRFASLQSATGRRLLEEHRLSSGKLDTVVLIEGGRVFTRSGAALRIARRLRWPWPLLYALMVVPWFVRDLLYVLIAHNRYCWFGRSGGCRMPRSELRERFLD